ncbi:hypothetical protein [Acidovorax sp. ACV01]|uniref:hypothetical protein n=1 Tax=Acidovorax sp. ACV01 TaxID=2769311 RepID=UPI00177CA3EE|nr:hypothetical protein [Acidovorax sp. ACV01]MBD9392945.1 hypothetical protein [Acidovorax sp. ACV01]
MKKHIAPMALFVLAALTHASAWASTYSFTNNPYDPASLHNYTPPCSDGNCANFTAALAPTATFTTAVPLAPNLTNTDVLFPGGNILAFTVSDGITTYTLGDPQVTVYQVRVSTDAAGQVTALSMIVARWQNPGPHSGANMRLDSVNTAAGAYHNVICQAVDIEDRCSIWEASGSIDGNTSWANVGAVPAGAVQSVPVDNPFALALAALGVLGVALRKRGAWLTQR